MRNVFAIHDWYWIVGGDESHVWSSARAKLVAADDQEFVAWAGNERNPTRIASLAELSQVFAEQYPAGMLSTYAADVRWRKEVGGVVSQTFGPLFTDRETQSMIARTIQSIDLGLITAPINYKGPSGFAAISRDVLVAIGTEVAAHVQAAFDAEMSVDVGIADGTITTIAEIDAAFA